MCRPAGIEDPVLQMSSRSTCPSQAVSPTKSSSLIVDYDREMKKELLLIKPAEKRERNADERS